MIAGTNGKGSVTLKIQKVLQYSGYNVGIFVSPHLFSFKERIGINDTFIEQQYFSDQLEQLFDIAEINKLQLTFFEYLTCLAFLYFKNQKAQFVALETGLGGRLDSTNIINTSILSVITSIGYDHMKVLGNTLEQIAIEKAGIIKNGIPVVIGPNASPLYIFQNECQLKNSPLILTEIKDSDDFQVENKKIAYKAIETLQKYYNLQITSEAIFKGLNSNQNCRMQSIEQTKNKKCNVYVDVGHNESAIVILKNYLQNYNIKRRLFSSQNFDYKNLKIIFGISSQKDSKKILEILCEKSQEIYLVQAKHFRSMDVRLLEQQSTEIENKNCIKILQQGNIEQTINQVLSEAQQECTVLICGSFYIMKEVFQAFNIQIDADDYS